MKKEITRNIPLVDFRKTYISDICGVLDLHSQLEKDLVEIIWIKSGDRVKTALNLDAPHLQEDVEDAYHVITKRESKQSWADQLGISLSSINNTLTKLVSKGAIVKLDHTPYAYTLNRDYFPMLYIDIQNTSFTINYKFI